MKPPALLFGIPIANVTMAETIDLIRALIERGRATGRSHQLATVNVDFLANAIDDPRLTAILQRADACLADGMPVVWGASLLGMPIRERVAGADLVPLLFDVSQTEGWRIHVFGSSPTVAARAERLVADRFPDAHVTFEPGPMIADIDAVPDDVLDAIAEVDADVLCIALGNPKQEHFIDVHRRRLRSPVLIGIGGSLDMFVGERRRAPMLMQRIGTEWIFRALQEPRRLGRRYAHDIRTMGPRFAHESLAVRRRRSGAGLVLDVSSDTVYAHLKDDEIPSHDEWARAAAQLEAGADLRMSAATATSFRDSGVAQAIGLARIARLHGRKVSWDDDSTSPLRGLHELGVTASMLGADPE